MYPFRPRIAIVRQPRHARLAIPLIVLLAASGCVAPRGGTPASPPAVPDQERRQGLRARLEAYRELFETTVDAAARSILERATQSSVRKAAVDWRARIVDLNDKAVSREEEYVALLECWALAVRVREYFTAGDGKRLFMEDQPTAVAAAASLEEAIEQIARGVVPGERQRAIAAQVNAYAKENPIRGTFVMGQAPPFTLQESGNRALSTLLQLPLLPFAALGQVGSGVGKALDLPSAVDRFTQAVRSLPEDARWQLDSVLNDVQSGPAATEALRSFSQLSESSARLSSTADQLPGRVRAEIETLLSREDIPNQRLRDALADARSTIGDVDRTLQSARTASADVEKTVQAIAAAAQKLERTADAIGGAARDVTRMIHPGAPATSQPADADQGTAQPAGPAPEANATSSRNSQPTPPFDINDYARTADALTRTLTELRGAIADLQRLLGARPLAGNLDDLSGSARATVDHATAQAERLANGLTWRAAGLIALVFALAVCFRLFVPARRGASEK